MLAESLTNEKFKDTFYGKSKEEILKYCEQLDRVGYEVIPSCDNCDEKGKCKGHPEKVKN
jgi:hypothetical protein